MILGKPLNKKSAFTVIELATTVTLVGVIFAAGIISLISILRFYNTEQAKHRSADNMATVLTYIKKDAIQASSCTISNDASGNPQLQLTITDYAVAGHPSVTITYSLSADGRTLTRTRDGATRQITNLIDSANLPNYDFGPPDGYPQNYLFVDMHTRDGNNVAHQRMGVMLSEAPPP